jgi:hypothetical protein
VTKAHPAAQIVACFDEINIVGPAAAAVKLFEGLSMEVRTAGLTPVASKAPPYSSDQDMATAAAAELGVLHARDGLVIAGPPIGTDPFVRDFLSRKRQEVCDKIQHFVDLPHPLLFQDKWAILSGFLQLRLQHLSRTVPWPAASPTSNNMLQIFAMLPSPTSANPTPAQLG